MNPERISSRDPGAILPPPPFIPSEAAPAPKRELPPPRPPMQPPIAPDDEAPGAMASHHHLPAIVEPLEPEEPDTVFARTRALRHDGWTPDKQRLFLSRFAECGVVSEACKAAGMSARTAYNLRDRDAIFAAGWEAATIKARPRLADEVFSRSMTGIVERIYKDGVVVAERHRHDNKLAMAVLARLDARADRAEAEGAPHLDLAARWDEFLLAIGEDRRADIAGLLVPESADGENAPDRELRELHHREEDMPDTPKETHKAWQDGSQWWTDFPPPPGFEGKQVRRYGDYGYRRHCTPGETAAMEAREAEKAAALEARRAAWFGLAD